MICFAEDSSWLSKEYGASFHLAKVVQLSSVYQIDTISGNVTIIQCVC